MNIQGIAKIIFLKKEIKSKIRCVLTLLVGKDEFKVTLIQSKSKKNIETLNRIIYNENRICFEGYFDENGLIQLTSFSQAYLEPLYTKVTYKGKVISYNSVESIIEVNLENDVSSKGECTLIAKAFSSCKEGIDFIKSKLYGEVSFEGQIHNNAIFISKFI